MPRLIHLLAFSLLLVLAWPADAALKLRFNFEDSFGANQYVTDQSGNSRTGLCFDTNNWIFATNGGAGGSTAAFFLTNRLTTNVGIYEGSAYITVTNLGNMQSMTKGTISFWASFLHKPNQNITFLFDSKGTETTSESNVFRIHRYPASTVNRMSMRYWETNEDDGDGTLLTICPANTANGTTDTTTTNSIDHYVFTWDADSDEAKAFYNGTNCWTTNFIQPFLTFNGKAMTGMPWLCISGNKHGDDFIWETNFPNDAYHYGKLDEIRIYDMALTAPDVMEIYTNPTVSAWYVSTSGNDTNTGLSPDQAFRTINKGVAETCPGGTLYVLAGVWDEEVEITNSITVKASGAVSNIHYFSIAANNVTLDGFDITDSKLTTNGASLGAIYFSPGYYTNIWVINNHIHDGRFHAPNGAVINFAESGGIARQAWCVVSNNLVTDNWGHGILVQGLAHTIVNNTFSNGFGSDGINIQGSNHVIRGNAFYAYGHNYVEIRETGNAAIDGSYLCVSYANEDGTTNHEAKLWVDTFTNASMIWRKESSPYVVIRNATWSLADTGGYSNEWNIIDSNWTFYASSPAPEDTASVWDWTIHNAAITTSPTNSRGSIGSVDFFQSNGPGGPTGASSVQTGRGFLIEGNLFANGLQAQIGMCSYPSNNETCGYWTFRNNIFYAIDKQAFIGYPFVSFLNNAFIRCANYSGANPIQYTWSDESGFQKNRGSNGEIKNTIFYGCGQNQTNSGWYEMAENLTPDPIMDLLTNSDFNFVASEDFNPKRATNNYPGQSGFWNEPHGINGGDPAFIDFSNFFFRHKYGSVLINAGTNIATITNDYSGMLRPLGGTNDIGPFEFDPNLRVWLDFDQGFESTNYVEDVTGYGHHAWKMDSTNWITRTNRTDDLYAGHWMNVGTIAVYPLSQYGAITNLANIEYLTNATITFWASWPSNTIRYDKILDAGAELSGLDYTNTWTLQYGTFGTAAASTGAVFGIYDASDIADCRSVIAWNTPRDASNATPTWRHIGLTWNAASNTVIGYLNGASISTNTLGVPWLRVSTNLAGRGWIGVGASTHSGTPEWEDDGQPNSGFFMGDMDDVRIYDRELSSSEIEAVYGEDVIATGGGSGGGDGGTTNTLQKVTLRGAKVTARGGVRFR